MRAFVRRAGAAGQDGSERASGRASRAAPSRGPRRLWLHAVAYSLILCIFAADVVTPPDNVSICFAYTVPILFYAAYKEASGQPGFQPARCGNSNARIDAILGRFGAALPEFVGDVIPRIEDIMHRDPFKVSADDTCARALELLDLHDVRALPVVGKDGRQGGRAHV